MSRYEEAERQYKKLKNIKEGKFKVPLTEEEKFQEICEMQQDLEEFGNRTEEEVKLLKRWKKDNKQRQILENKVRYASSELEKNFALIELAKFDEKIRKRGP